MPSYRIDLIDEEGKLVEAQEHESADDVEATDYAGSLKRRRVIRLWCVGNLVKSFRLWPLGRDSQ